MNEVNEINLAEINLLHFICIGVFLVALIRSFKDIFKSKEKREKEKNKFHRNNRLLRFYPKHNESANPEEVFHNAVKHGEVDAVIEWLNLGINPNSQLHSSITPLHVSASLSKIYWEKRHIEKEEDSLNITNILINRGACVNAISGYYYISRGIRATPLDACKYAMKWKYNKQIENNYLNKIKEILKDNGAITCSKLDPQLTAICGDIRRGDSSTLEAYLKEGNNVNNVLPEFDRFPRFLDVALASNKHDIVQIILSKGGLMKPIGIYKDYPLHLAKDVEMVKLLISAGAEINPTNKNFHTPLDVESDDEIIDILRLNGGKTYEELRAEY